MYRLGEREHHHHKLYILLAVFAIIVLAIFFSARHILAPNTQISGSPAVVTKVSYAQTKLQTVDEPFFTMSIPATWKLSTMYPDVPNPTYIWKGTVGEDRSRWISAYVDMSLPTVAVNRAIHIQSSGTQINVIGSTSDNCTSYTGAANTQTGKTPAKWENIDFLCDTGNYARDVVGIVSQDGLNTIKITGPTKGQHQYFFTYTDDSNQPDYSIFSSALQSFKAK